MIDIRDKEEARIAQVLALYRIDPTYAIKAYRERKDVPGRDELVYMLFGVK